MPFSLEAFAQKRQCVYHLTSTSNVEHIAKDMRIYSASHWMVRAGRLDLMTAKRISLVQLRVGKRIIILRDQRPLYEGNMRLLDGLSFGDFIQVLNERVFFWPGDDVEPIGYGRNHFYRYAAEAEPVSIIRVETSELIKENGNAEPEFCRFNSGSPRCSKGKGSPRGRDTFVSSSLADFSAGKVAEVTYRTLARLPSTTVVRKLDGRRWIPLKP